MKKIKDILAIKLDDDIQSVIDLNSNQEETLKEELDSFILTESLAKHLSEFCDFYRGNTKQPGLWLSGFYGSGKSFLAKIIGLLLSDKMILGTRAQDRFSAKFEGLPNKEMLQNNVSALNRTKNHIVQFDAAKESSNLVLAKMMLGAFLRSLGFLDNHFGLMEYDLWLNGKYSDFENTVKEITGQEWEQVKKSPLNLLKAAKAGMLAIGYSPEEYTEAVKIYQKRYDDYDANKLVEDLERYLDRVPDMRIVFMIDEVSESIIQKRISILDLEGISEALNAMGRKVWTIAIAQQKLDDVINNANVSRDKLAKIIDRFKNHLDIKAEEVDIIIRKRLLAKTPNGVSDLSNYFTKNSGMIGDITNLGTATLSKTQKAETYANYYPFFEHQFKMLQYFLFGTKTLASTQVGTRGMLISAFDTLKKESVKEHDLFTHVNAAQLRRQAEENVSESLHARYQQAKAIVCPPLYKYVKGEELLQTIDFLTKVESVATTAENIAKSYVIHPEEYYEVKAEVVKALDALVEEKVLLLTNNQYRITSETEQRILKDLNDPDISMSRIRGAIEKNLKPLSIVKESSDVTIDGKKVSFSVKLDNGGYLTQLQNSPLQIVLHDVFVTSQTPGYVDQVKRNTQDQKNLISIVPNTSKAKEISDLQERIIRLEDLALKNYSTKEEKEIQSSLTKALPDLRTQLNQILQEAYSSGSLVYCYNVATLTDANYQSTIKDQQKKLYNNIYTRRLSAELSDSLAPKVLKTGASQLPSLFTDNEFKFFDSTGRFIGDNLSVVSETLALLKNFTTGQDVEEKLEAAPTGYSYGTIITAMAALLRGSKIIVKYNGDEFHSYQDEDLQKVFTNSREFRKASFKAVAQSLKLKDKQEIIDILKDDCNYKKWTSADLPYTINDFELVDAIRTLSRELRSSINQKIMGDPEKEKIFHRSVQASEVFKQYMGVVTEANYLTTAHNFLQDEDFVKAVENVDKDLKFIKSGWEELKEERRFIGDVKDELEKSQVSIPQFADLQGEFEALYASAPVAKAGQLKKITQQIRDLFYQQMVEASKAQTDTYSPLKQKAEALKEEIKQYPIEWNETLMGKVENLVELCQKLMVGEITLPMNSVKCKPGDFLLRDFLHAKDKAKDYEAKLAIWESEIVTSDPNPGTDPDPDPDPKPVVRKMRKQIPTGTKSVEEYRQWLTAQLSNLKNFSSTDQLDFDN